MPIDAEIERYRVSNQLLEEFIEELSQLDRIDVKSKHYFLAEAVVFKLFRNYERFIRGAFLQHCVEPKTLNGTDVFSKLKCSDSETAEAILKSGNRFLDWGNVEAVRKLANLVFKDGFPIVDTVAPILSSLIDLQKFRNFVAHDSEEAASGFRKSRDNYVRVGDATPETVGELAIYRRSLRADITIKGIYQKVSQVGTIYSTL